LWRGGIITLSKHKLLINIHAPNQGDNHPLKTQTTHKHPRTNRGQSVCEPQSLLRPNNRSGPSNRGARPRSPTPLHSRVSAPLEPISASLEAIPRPTMLHPL
jgi:hypothetical protein